MRVLRRFDVPQLMATAEASRNNVGRFVLGLRRAGVIRVVRQHCNGHAGDCAVYQLVRNLGPHAPRVRIDGTCWDPNGQRFIGGEDD